MNTKSAAFLIKSADSTVNLGADVTVNAATDVNAQAEKELNGTENGVVYPVSYTHLAVYKRQIHAYGLHLRTGKQWHPAYEAFCQLKQPCVVTMENLQGITGASAEHNRAYIVENEMVFSYLISQMEDEEVTLLCTS